MTKSKDVLAQQKVPISGYVAFVIGVACFSGLLGDLKEPWSILRALDFNALAGQFGKIAGGTDTFLGKDWNGARGGFMYTLTLVPAVILALGLVRVIEGYGGLAAAQRLITPVFRPIFNIPGICGLAYITHLQNTDSAAGMTKELYDEGYITDKERTIFAMLQFSGPGAITNYFSIWGGIYPFFILISAPIALPLGVMLICKCLGAIFMRIVVSFDKKVDTVNASISVV